MRLALALLLVALPARSFGASTRATLETGAAFPHNDRVDAGLSYGVEGAFRLAGRLSLVGGLMRAGHGLTAAPSQVIDATTLTLGFEFDLDLTPIQPVITAGPSLQHAVRRGTSSTADVPGLYAGVGANWRPLPRFEVGAEVRYLTSGFANDTFPGYGFILLKAGFVFSD